MAATKRTLKRAPSKTKEGRENQLIDLAVSLAEQQLAAGTASSQVITHFLKLGTVRSQLEMEKIHQENLLLQAKTDAIKSAARIEALYKDALSAMRGYRGLEEEPSEED